MHASWCEVVVVIVGQKNSADENGNDAAHIESLRDNIAENAEEICQNYLCNFVMNKKTKVFEHK